MARIIETQQYNPELLGALNSTFQRIQQIKAQNDEKHHRERAYAQQDQEAKMREHASKLATEREERLAANSELQNQIQARELAFNESLRALPGAPVEGEETPAIDVPGVTGGGLNLPGMKIRRQFQSQIEEAARRKDRESKIAAGGVEVNPDNHEIIKAHFPLMAGLYTPGSILPKDAAEKMLGMLQEKGDLGQMDAGGTIKLFDKKTGKIISEVPKTPAPKAAGTEAESDIDGLVQMLGSGTPASELPKFAKKQSDRLAAISLARENGMDVFNTPKDKEKTEKLRDIQRDANELAALMHDKDVIAAIGPQGGTWASIKGRFVDLPPNVQRAHQLMSSLSDTELRRRSGAQINESEFQRMLKFAPDLSRPMGHNMTAINGLLKSATEGEESILRPADYKRRHQKKNETPAATAPADGAPTRRATKRFNPATGALEDVQ